MACTTPINIKNAQRMIDSEEFAYHIVPCGKCINCLKKRANAWGFRLHQQLKVSTTACFITLTYGETYCKNTGILLFGENPPLIQADDELYSRETLSKKHLQNFWKRLRKQNHGNIKYFACGEYGSNYGRPHYHAIVFNLDLKLMVNSKKISQHIWQKGKVDIASCSLASIAYVVGYFNKPSIVQNPIIQKEFQLMSKGLGANYLTDQIYNMHLDRAETHVNHPAGFTIPIPRYYRSQIWNKEELYYINQELLKAGDIDYLEMANDYGSSLDFVFEILNKRSLEHKKRDILHYEQKHQSTRKTF